MPASAAQPAHARQLSPWDNLCLIGWQIKFNLEKAQQKWEQDFRDQLKTYLLTRPQGERELVSAGVIKISIVEKGGNQSLNVSRLEELFKNMFGNQAPAPVLTAADVRTLFESGALGVKDPEAVFAFLHTRGMVANRAEVLSPPSTVTQSLTWKVLNTSAQQGAAVFADLPDRVHQASGARLEDADLALMLPPTQPVVVAAVTPAVVPQQQQPQPQASETVAVRRRRNRVSDAG